MSDWSIVYDTFDPEREGLREALFTLGNGYFATRGADPESRADGVHYPGTYLAGGYNRAKTEIAGHVVENEDLVNLPNWLVLRFRIDGGEWFDCRKVEILEYRKELDLRRGILSRRIDFRSADGKHTRLEERRIVHMDNQHVAALEISIEAVDWGGRLEILSALDGRVENNGVERYRDLASKHLEPLESEEIDDEGILLEVMMNQSEVHVAQAARTRLFRDGKPARPKRRLESEPGWIAHHLEIDVERGENVTVEKVVTLYSSRDRAISECGLEARNRLGAAGSFDVLLGSHTRVWKHLWERFDITIRQDHRAPSAEANLILRLHTFHLIQTTSNHTIDLDVGVPSRGWHGEAYRGHIFWDELYIFPIFNHQFPEVTRALLMYRFRRLERSRRAAREAGYRGAMYPWQSGSNGREESQTLHLNPKSGRWIEDNSHLQRHVNAAIAYNLCKYYAATNDMEFFLAYGAEMLIEISRFLASLATWNEERERYEILGVMGPDEYHDSYPGREEGGLDNNSYTNIMTVWVLCRSLTMLDRLPEDRRRELSETLGLEKKELEKWDDISRKMYVPFHDDGIICQFEGYDQLEEFDWEGYREKYGEIQRLDRILEAENDTPNRYKASKQADVLMLFFLFSAEEIQELFERLGYPFEYETIPRNIEYYMKRTSHGSTLSRVVHSWVLARSDRAGSWKLFVEALRSDYDDIQGGTTPEGIHLGAMAGTVDIIQRCYTGMEMRGQVLWFNPSLPDEIEHLAMTVRYRGHTLDIRISQEELTIRSLWSTEEPIRIGHCDTACEIDVGEERTFRLNR